MFLTLLRRSARLPTGCRSFGTGQKSFNAQQSPLFQLRQRTGLAYNLCREALNKHNNDINQAEVWLQAQALAHGLQKATKVGGRSTKEGLVSLAVSQDNKSITLLELNCETDFVAKNQIFRDFTVDLIEQAANFKDGFTVQQSHADSTIEESVANGDTLNKISGQIAPLLTRLGENIRVHKLISYRSSCSQTSLFGQVHARASQRKLSDLDISAGRFGAIVALKAQTNNITPAVGNRLCHHVIGYNPTYIELPDEIKRSLEEAENERSRLKDESTKDVQEEEDEEERNTDELHIEGGSDRDDWPSIMDQHLIMSDEQTVRDFCKDNDMSIVYFKRFECGTE